MKPKLMQNEYDTLSHHSNGEFHPGTGVTILVRHPKYREMTHEVPIEDWLARRGLLMRSDRWDASATRLLPVYRITRRGEKMLRIWRGEDVDVRRLEWAMEAAA